MQQEHKTVAKPEHNDRYDIVILGGGIAGAALALALADCPLKIALVDAAGLDGTAPARTRHSFDPRVCALTEASRTLLDNIGAWSSVAGQRACPYSAMQVWDEEGTGTIAFSAAELGVPDLGHIVENSVLRSALLGRLEDSPVTLMADTEVGGLTMDDDGVTLNLKTGDSLQARLLVGADGAESRARSWAGIPLRQWDYLHHGVVTTVETEQPHQDTAWQIFLNSGPLAFLPLPPTEDGRHFCSVVWSAVPERAAEIMAMDDHSFCQAIGAALEHRLGRVLGADQRFCFPLRQRHARQYHRNNVVLIGDAAHTIHPLAGQGANLGLLDVASLAGEIRRACDRGEDFVSTAVLDRYQRSREGHNLAMAGVMEGLERLFNSDNLMLRWLRNTGLNLTDRLPLLKQEIIARAMGIRGELPELARPRSSQARSQGMPGTSVL